MRTRLLPADDWPRLEGTALGGVWAQLPATALVLAVEADDGALLGCWALIPVWHAEGIWIAPAHRRKGGVARRLWAAVRAFGATHGLAALVTGAGTPEVARLLQHAGAVPVPYQEYVLPLPPGARPRTQQEAVCQPQ